MSTDTIHICSQRFGTYDVAADRVVAIPHGLIGLPDARRFALLEPHAAGSPFRYLLCVDQPELGFLVCDPEVFCPGYRAKLPSAGLPADAAVLAIVTVPEDVRAMTANLMAPVVIDCATREGRQLILEGSMFGTRHRLFEDAAARPIPRRAGNTAAQP